MDATWDEICERGRMVQSDMDSARWVIGDDAQAIAKEWGRDKVGQYAAEINVPRSSVYEYRQMAAFYENSARAEFLESNPLITYSHMKTAKRIGDEATAYRLLERASMRAWTVDRFYKFVAIAKGRRKVKPDDLLLALKASKANLDRGRGLLTFEIDDTGSAQAFIEYVKAQKPGMRLEVHEVRS